MSADADDDEFDELFSFGTTPTAAASAERSSSPLDFGLDDDNDPATKASEATANGGANGTFEIGSRQGSRVASSTGGSADEHDDLFGSPPPGTVPTSPMAAAADDDFLGLLDGGGAGGDAEGGPGRPRLATEEDDNFHMHDAGTRDFLEWLDDDGRGKADASAAAASGDEPTMDLSLEMGAGGVGKAATATVAGDAAAATAGGATPPVPSSLAAAEPTRKDTGESFDFDKEILGSANVDGEEPLADGARQREAQVGGGSVPPASASASASASTVVPSSGSSKRDAATSDGRPPYSDTGTADAAPPRTSSGNDGPTVEDAAAAVSPDDTGAAGDGATEAVSAHLSEPSAAPPPSATAFPEDRPDAPSVDNFAAVLSGNADGAPVTFSTLADAVRSTQSTMDQIRSLISSSPGGEQDAVAVMSNDDRPHLWAKATCGKTLEDVSTSSVADSFQEWDESFDIDRPSGAEDGGDPLVDMSKDAATVLSERLVASGMDPTGEDGGASQIATLRRNICSLLLFYYHSGCGSNAIQNCARPTVSDEANATKPEWDPLLPPVAAALLFADIHPAAASVMLANLTPSSLPLMALTNAERIDAAKLMHSQFYLLASYHLPLLVLHLDRYASGWHWPRKVVSKLPNIVKVGAGKETSDGKEERDEMDDENATKMSRHLQDHGAVPLSWFVSHFAGECDRSALDYRQLLSLWDVLLLSRDDSLKFFLALAVLEKHSDILLMLRGKELVVELDNVMDFKEGNYEEAFVGEGADAGIAVEESSGQYRVPEWHSRAKSLSETTPSSVVERLRSIKDEAVKNAHRERQRIAEERLRAKQEEEARKRREAMEKERARKTSAAHASLTRARLVTYYQKHNPEKVHTVDKILEIYKGRIDVLDTKLKLKYGEGFIPSAQSIKLSANAGKLLLTLNQGMQSKKQQIAHSVAARRAKHKKKAGDVGFQVAVKVSSDEVLPIVCSSKASKIKDGNTLARGRYSATSADALKFYLVDCRPDTTAKEQGRFPTSVALSPEALQDPDRIQQHVEMFESLRGAVHICVMGEGFSSFPTLYDHPLTHEEERLSQDDISRISNCALFFIKKGFPFVSVLDGGFAAAHAWLSRKGKSSSLSRSIVLVDYDEEVSLFGQLESAYREQQELANASTREKTTRALQKVIDNSMARLTIEENRINEIALELSSQEGRQKVKQSVSKLFASKQGRQPPSKYMMKRFSGFGSEFSPVEELISDSIVFDERGKERLQRTQGGGTSTDGRDESVLSLSERPQAPSPSKAPPPSAFKKNPFAGFSGMQSGAPESKESILKRNPFASLGAKAGTVKSVTKTEGGQQMDFVEQADATAKESFLKRTPFGSIGARVGTEKAPSSKGDEQKPKTDVAEPKESILKRNPFANLGSKRGTDIEVQDGRKFNFGNFNLRHREQRDTADQAESNESGRESGHGSKFKMRAFQGFGTIASLKPAATVSEGFSASEESISFHEEDRGVPATVDSNTIAVDKGNSSPLVENAHGREHSSVQVGQTESELDSGPPAQPKESHEKRETAVSEATPDLFPVQLNSQSSTDQALFDIGDLTSDEVSGS